MNDYIKNIVSNKLFIHLNYDKEKCNFTDNNQYYFNIDNCKINNILLGKIIFNNFDNNEFSYKIETKNLNNNQEDLLLIEFFNLVEYKNNSNFQIIYYNHNFSYLSLLSKRCYLNSLSLPNCLFGPNKKKWEIKNFINLHDIWNFNSYNLQSDIDNLMKLFPDIIMLKNKMSNNETLYIYFIIHLYLKICLNINKQNILN